MLFIMSNNVYFFDNKEDQVLILIKYTILVV